MEADKLENTTIPTDDGATCIYCGRCPAETRDHVVARCLFQTPPPPNLVTVPACRDCNLKKSSDDTFLRDYLTGDLAGHYSPTAEAMFNKKVIPSIRHNRSELARLVRRTPGKRLSLRTRAGLLVGEGVQIPLPRGRIDAILFKMVRGLYFDSRRIRLVDDIPYEVLRYPLEEWDTLAGGPFKDQAAKILGDVFECAFMYGAEDPTVTLWLMRFYGRVVFTIRTGSIVDGAND